MKLINRETVSCYDCGNMEPHEPPHNETADVVVAYRFKGGKRVPQWQSIPYEWHRVDGRYVRKAGPVGWLTDGDCG